MIIVRKLLCAALRLRPVFPTCSLSPFPTSQINTKRQSPSRPQRVLEPLTLFPFKGTSKKNTGEPHTFIPRQLKPIYRVCHDTTLLKLLWLSCRQYQVEAYWIW
jgi:hypothetical protein